MSWICGKSAVEAGNAFPKAATIRGFTLIELMIVIGIIGILVSISGSAYRRYQAKAYQSEAKLALTAIYALEKSFYAEHLAYLPGMAGIGYEPQGFRRMYSVGWALMYSGNIDNVYVSSAITLPRAYMDVNNPFTNPGGISCGNASLSVIPLSTADNPQEFSVVALGIIREGQSVCDRWTINQSKILVNEINGT